MIRRVVSFGALSLLLGPLCAAAGAGQLTVLKPFTIADGTNPQGPLLLDNGVLYGTTTAWGNVSAGNDPSGNIFRMNVDGTGYQILSQFAHNPGYGPSGTLAFDGTTLYGTTTWIPPSVGNIVAVNIDGSNPHDVHTFGSGDGAYPVGGVILNGTTLYGTAFDVVYKVETDGSGFQVLAATGSNFVTQSGVTLLGSTLYGATSGDGASRLGTIYKVGVDGSGFEVLHSFAGGPADGFQPLYVDLVTDGLRLYGTTYQGGANNLGTVFSINLDGSGFQILHSFAGDDGSEPSTGLTLLGSTLYGVTGGPLDIFRINTDGSDFETLYQDTSNDSSLRRPLGALTPGGPNVFYGTTYGTSQSHGGTIFMFTVPEPSSCLLLALGVLGLVRFRPTKKGQAP